MSLSLEVKKFINSEHTGEYIEIELPGELEVRRPARQKSGARACAGGCRSQPMAGKRGRTRI